MEQLIKEISKEFKLIQKNILGNIDGIKENYQTMQSNGTNCGSPPFVVQYEGNSYVYIN